ncbi:hypothetical protein SAMN02787020_0777 [Brevundimonas sp. 374]|nr:hypothetical protein SAMN02787020_0777 [Brevundimonas sp. 374]
MQLLSVIVVSIVTAVFTVVILGIVGFLIVAGIQYENPILFAGVGLLLLLAIPYFVLYHRVMLFKATKPSPKRSFRRA